MKFLLPVLFQIPFITLFSSSVSAAEFSYGETKNNIEQTLNNFGVLAVVVSAGIIIFVVILTFIIKNESELLKKIFFSLIVIPTLLTTLLLVGSTVYLNNKSDSGGPVHWHADFEIYNCGKELDIVNPKGFSNKVGTSTLHEHNDKRIHLEGLVMEPSDASLGNFFKVIDGKISAKELVVPTTDGVVNIVSPGYCESGEFENDFAELQVFLFESDGKTYTQRRLSEPEKYIISPESIVPPGDCIIIEFAPYKERTEKLCQQYQVKEKLGEINGR